MPTLALLNGCMQNPTVFAELTIKNHVEVISSRRARDLVEKKRYFLTLSL